MKTYALRSTTLFFTLLVTSLAGCKKGDEATPQLSCRTMEYSSLFGTGGQSTVKFTYGGDSRPIAIESVALPAKQKTVWTYSYQTVGKVTITRTIDGISIGGATTLTLDNQGRVTNRTDGYDSYNYTYDSGGYLTKIKITPYGGAPSYETVLTVQNGYLRSVQIGVTAYQSTYTVTTDEQAQSPQPAPVNFAGLDWLYINFLGKPYRGIITSYTDGKTTYQISNGLTLGGGLISRETTYTDPKTKQSVNYRKETFTTTCQ